MKVGNVIKVNESRKEGYRKSKVGKMNNVGKMNTRRKIE